MTWQEFEIFCLNYLTRIFGNYFSSRGGSDSTHSDIEYSSERINFAIECKMPHSQSGQFVLIPNEEYKTFDFSKKNKTSRTLDGTEEIITYVNEHFDEFSSPGTKGVDLQMDPSVYEKWIKAMYRQKNVEYIMTSINENICDENIVILPLDKIGEYFDISCKYRVKKSGSSGVGKKKYKDACKILKQSGIEFVEVDGYQIYMEKKLINSIHVGEEGKYKFNLNTCEPAFTYMIRVLSNTFNANIIFSLKIKDGVTQDPTVLETFRNIISAD